MKLQSNLSNLLNTLSRDNTDSDSLFKDIPFVCEYNRLEQLEDNCCFNHVIGLPSKSTSTLPSPIYQWQYDYLIKHLEQHKYNWVLKATGCGVTEIILRWILYRSLVTDEWSHGIVPVITGPNIDLAKRLIERAYTLVYPFFPHAKKNDYTLYVNNVELTAFPSGNLDAVRSLTNVRCIVLDEADFFRKGEQQDARKISERYISKCDNDILIVSTPNAPDGLMETIQNEEPSLYNKILLPYTCAVGTIFTKEQIEENKKSPSFDQEYNLHYLSGIGNLFNIQSVEKCIKEYTLDDTINTSQTYIRWIGVDPGWGQDSTFAIVVVQWINREARIVYHESVKNPLYEPMLRQINKLIKHYSACKVFIDASASNVCHHLATQYGEYTKYEKMKPEVFDRLRYSECRAPLIVPIAFNQEHERMMQMLQSVIYRQILEIHPSFEEVITALKSAKNKPNKPYSLDKQNSAFHDSLDALRLALCGLRAKQ